jgi:hypothetical protein
MNFMNRNHKYARLALSAILLFSALSPLAAQERGAGKEPFIQVIPHFEYGFIGVLDHRYRSGAGETPGAGGTDFNFRTMGGQDTLFPYQRYSAEVVLGGRNRVTLLYQPLTLNTRTVAGRNGTTAPVYIDDATFDVNTPIDITYGFDFWRASWLYDFARSPATILGAGVSLQIRNASIVFTSVDVVPAERAVQQNIGLVPILKARAAHWFTPGFGLDFEADGFYASSAIFNGSGNPFEGWIWDAALSAKTRFTANTSAFLTVRSIGGGARGSNAYSYESATTSVNPDTFNALATMAVTLGVSVE